MIDWDKFKRGEFAVRCDTEDKAKAFLRECAKEGMHWSVTGDPLAVHTRWDVYKNNTCYCSGNETYDIMYTNAKYSADGIIEYAPPEPDQSLKSDAGKPQLSLVPTEITRCIARVREYGVNKYHARDSWREVDPQRYRDAMYRHMLAYIDNPDGVDEESGLPHLWHCAANIAFLCEMEKEKK